MHWNAQNTPGKYRAAPIVGPIQCVLGLLPVQPKMKSETGIIGVAMRASLRRCSGGVCQFSRSCLGMK
jgi:hypothetical protein